ncbi:MAG: phosphatidylglycerophosphatase A [Desulfomonile sp.]|nr:phosphatidylglycerophosphatase A [Desulfomonile sp.]
MTRLVHLARIGVVTSCGLGYIPVIPGTVGSLPAVLAFVVIMTQLKPEYHTAALAAALAVSGILCIVLAPWAERYWGRKDPRYIVLDEVAGFFLTVVLFRGQSILWTAVTAFVATRIADIIKPPPANLMERLPGGWGILLDDLVASLYGAAALHLIAWFAPGLL